MSSTIPNLELLIQDENDYYDINIFNENFSRIKEYSIGINEDIDNLEKSPIGVRNLLSNGDFAKGSSKGWVTGTTGSIFRIVAPSSTSQSKSYLETSKNNFYNYHTKLGFVEKGDLVTVSFMARQAGTGGIFPTSFHITDGAVSNPLSDSIPFSLTTTWELYKFTFVAKTKGDDTHRLYMYGSGDDTKLLHITDIKVEPGSHPTGFIPSTEDINEVIALKEYGGTIGTVDIKNGSVNNDSIETTKGVLGISVAGNKGIAITGTGIRPNAYSPEHNLGELSYPWNIIYGKTLNLNGTFELRSANLYEDMISTTKRALDFDVKGVDGTGTGLIFEASGGGTGTLRPYSSNNGKIDIGSPTARIRDIFIGSFNWNENGMTNINNQFRLVWGVTTLNLAYGTSSSKQINYPLPFNNECYAAFADADYDNTAGDTAGTAGVIANASVMKENVTDNKTKLVLHLGHAAVGSTGWNSGERNIRVRWLAIGH